MTVRWEDEKLDGECFSWMTEWRAAPMQTIAGIMELYEQLLPTKLYNSRKTKTTDDPDARCRMCGKAQESVAHVLSGCSVLAQTKYLSRHNAALKILFSELLKSYQLIKAIPPWYSPTQPKPSYENKQATVYWDVLGGCSKELYSSVRDLLGAERSYYFIGIGCNSFSLQDIFLEITWFCFFLFS